MDVPVCGTTLRSSDDEVTRSRNAELRMNVDGVTEGWLMSLKSSKSTSQQAEPNGPRFWFFLFRPFVPFPSSVNNFSTSLFPVLPFSLQFESTPLATQGQSDRGNVPGTWGKIGVTLPGGEVQKATMVERAARTSSASQPARDGSSVERGVGRAHRDWRGPQSPLPELSGPQLREACSSPKKHQGGVR